MKTLLYVDDNADDRFLLESAARLARVSFRVKTIESGAAAVQFFGENGDATRDPAIPVSDIAFLDLKMPGMDGFQLLGWMRANPSTQTIPVVIFSASPIHRDIERGFAAGANYFITKPSELSTLVEIMKAADRLLDDTPDLAALDRYSAPNSLKDGGQPTVPFNRFLTS